MEKTFDIAIIGGGAAGLSAALTLSRALRSVVVIDAGEPRNAPADGIHGLLGHEGLPPLELTRIGRGEVESYDGTILNGRATEITGNLESGFAVELATGETVRARRLILATGLTDLLPDIPGLQALWGKDVLHCPYCHGWEVRGKAIGIIATGPLFAHQALLFRQLSSDVTLFLNDVAKPTEEQFNQLAARNIRVVAGAVREVLIESGRLRGVLVEDEVYLREALATGPKFIANSELGRGLGLHPVPHPSGLGEQFEANPDGSTAIPGVWVVGNNSNIGAQVVMAMAAGVTTGAAVNSELIADDVARAVESARELTSWR